MNAILLHPQNAAQAKLFRETAEKQGVKMVSIPKKILEDFDDMIFGAKLQELSKKAKVVSREKVMKTFDKIINSK